MSNLFSLSFDQHIHGKYWPSPQYIIKLQKLQIIDFVQEQEFLKLFFI
jgi:hypothetical protein